MDALEVRRKICKQVKFYHPGTKEPVNHVCADYNSEANHAVVHDFLVSCVANNLCLQDISNVLGILNKRFADKLADALLKSVIEEMGITPDELAQLTTNIVSSPEK